MKLKKLSEVITYLKETNDIENWRKIFQIYEINDFGKQIPKIEMFILWDEKDNRPMEKPDLFDDFKYTVLVDKESIWFKQCIKYQQAKANVLFEGFVQVFQEINNPNVIRVENKEMFLEFTDGKVFWYDGEVKQIQDLENEVEVKDEVAKKLYGI